MARTMTGLFTLQPRRQTQPYVLMSLRRRLAESWQRRQERQWEAAIVALDHPGVREDAERARRCR